VYHHSIIHRIIFSPNLSSLHIEYDSNRCVSCIIVSATYIQSFPPQFHVLSPHIIYSLNKYWRSNTHQAVPFHSTSKATLLNHYDSFKTKTMSPSIFNCTVLLVLLLSFSSPRVQSASVITDNGMMVRTGLQQSEGGSYSGGTSGTSGTRRQRRLQKEEELQSMPAFDFFDAEADLCDNGPDPLNERPVLGACNVTRFPTCGEDEDICYNRKPSRDHFHPDNHQHMYYIQYDRVFCYPLSWLGCSSCSPGRYCKSEKRCILEEDGYPCAEWF
jgi:hypothetical protein